MAVINKVSQKDTIITINIIRIGAKAQNFNAAKTFDEEVIKFNKSQEEIAKQENKIEEERYATYLLKKNSFLIEMEASRAQKTGTGLRILKLKKTKGKKVFISKKVTANYTLYTADGKKLVSNMVKVANLTNTQKPMISGLKEGLLSMRSGEKSRFFIPYTIGFGNQKFGPFPSKSDLVFEVEILKIDN